MLERLVVRNFKLFEEIEVELGEAVVFVGPNNMGKTSALQALALWDYGVRRWLEKRGDKPPKKRSGVTLNRRELLSLPVPETNLLWRNLRVREVFVTDGKQRTENIRIDVEVHGVTDGVKWSCGLEFDYANAESLYCRPLGWASGERPESPVPRQALHVGVAYLPPMSGLAPNEVRLDPGAVQVRLGEGRTAEVLRNLCYSLLRFDDKGLRWDELKGRMKGLFGVHLEEPNYVPERGELTLAYRDQNDLLLDISAAGRGLQQTLLLIAYILANPGSVLLLDEPDAHLEYLRQRQIYNTLTEIGQKYQCQIVAATHSEVVLNEAAGRDVVVAFLGRPHRIDGRSSQLLKSLKQIPFQDYYLAESTGWVLYLEGATDLAILVAFARALGHPAVAALERPFVHYVGNQPNKAREHFHGLRETRPDLMGVVLTDRLDQDVLTGGPLTEIQWTRREIENYLCDPEVLIEYAGTLASGGPTQGPLFASSQAEKFRTVMRRCVERRVPKAALEDGTDRYWRDAKASDELLDLVFESFFEELELPNLMSKTDYHRLAEFVPQDKIDPEVVQVLDSILEVHQQASPVTVSK